MEKTASLSLVCFLAAVPIRLTAGATGEDMQVGSCRQVENFPDTIICMEALDRIQSNLRILTTTLRCESGHLIATLW